MAAGDSSHRPGITARHPRAERAKGGFPPPLRPAAGAAPKPPAGLPGRPTQPLPVVDHVRAAARIAAQAHEAVLLGVLEQPREGAVAVVLLVELRLLALHRVFDE